MSTDKRKALLEILEQILNDPPEKWDFESNAEKIKWLMEQLAVLAGKHS